MKEHLIGFGTAKLAKEKGFDWEVYYYYNINGFLKGQISLEYHSIKDFLYNWNNPKSDTYSAPTQSLLQKWLRDVHNIHINVSKILNDADRYSVYFQACVDYNHIDYLKDKYRLFKFNSYENALEDALYELLKTIKNG